MFKNSKKLFPKIFLSFEGSKFFRITFQLTQLVGRYQTVTLFRFYKTTYCIYKTLIRIHKTTNLQCKTCVRHYKIYNLHYKTHDRQHKTYILICKTRNLHYKTYDRHYRTPIRNLISSVRQYKTRNKVHRKGKSTFADRSTRTKTHICKRAFPFPLFPTAKKRINFPHLLLHISKLPEQKTLHITLYLQKAGLKE